MIMCVGRMHLPRVQDALPYYSQGCVFPFQHQHSFEYSFSECITNQKLEQQFCVVFQAGHCPYRQVITLCLLSERMYVCWCQFQSIPGAVANPYLDARLPTHLPIHMDGDIKNELVISVNLFHQTVTLPYPILSICFLIRCCSCLLVSYSPDWAFLVLGLLTFQKGYLFAVVTVMCVADDSILEQTVPHIPWEAHPHLRTHPSKEKT